MRLHIHPGLGRRASGRGSGGRGSRSPNRGGGDAPPSQEAIQTARRYREKLKRFEELLVQFGNDTRLRPETRRTASALLDALRSEMQRAKTWIDQAEADRRTYGQPTGGRRGSSDPGGQTPRTPRTPTTRPRGPTTPRERTIRRR